MGLIIILMGLEKGQSIRFSSEDIGILSSKLKVSSLSNFSSSPLLFSYTPGEDKEVSINKSPIIIATEFIGSALVTAPYIISCAFYTYGGFPEIDYKGIYICYLVGTPIIASVPIEAIDILFKRKGNFVKSLIGGFVGSSFGAILWYAYEEEIMGRSNLIGLSAVFLFPSIGATIGNNL